MGGAFVYYSLRRELLRMYVVWYTLHSNSMGGCFWYSITVLICLRSRTEVEDLTSVVAPINGAFSLLVVQPPTIAPLGDTGH